MKKFIAKTKIKVLVPKEERNKFQNRQNEAQTVKVKSRNKLKELARLNQSPERNQKLMPLPPIGSELSATKSNL